MIKIPYLRFILRFWKRLFHEFSSRGKKNIQRYSQWDPFIG